MALKISFFLASEELMLSLRETLKSVKDIPHILKVPPFSLFMVSFLSAVFPSLQNGRSIAYSVGAKRFEFEIMSLLFTHELFHLVDVCKILS